MRRTTMSQKHYRSLETSLETLKNESTRQRWELFHRAIASAKQSNTQAMQQADEARQAAAADVEANGDGETRDRLSIAR